MNLKQDDEPTTCKRFRPSLKCDECGGLLMVFTSTHRLCESCGIIVGITDGDDLKRVKEFYDSTKSMKPLYYMAHPYSGNEELNFKLANKHASILMDIGMHVYSPISSTHLVHREKRQSYDFWMALDKTIADRCDRLVLCPGWEDSNGCTIEKRWFESAGKPVFEFDGGPRLRRLS